MFASFKKLFRKDTEEDLATSIPEVSVLASATHSSGISSKPVTLSFPSQPKMATPETSPDMVALSVQSVLARLPNSLAGVVQSQGNGFFSLPAQWVVQELPKGSVKLSFGELRQIAPLGTFFENARHDQVLIELPLDEILTRLHPSHLSRRKNQKQTFVSPEITNVFGPRGEGVSLSSASATKPAKAMAPVETPTPVFQPIQQAPLAMPKFDKPLAAPAATPNIFQISNPPLHVLPSESATVPNEILQVPLPALSANWPEMIRRELAALNPTNTFIAFPMDQLERGLKTGKIILTWKQICQWIQPAVSNSGVPEETAVELPLHILAPLFLAKRQPKNQKKIYIGEMPDLFAGKTAVVPEQPVVMAAPVQPVAPIKMQPAATVEPTPIKMSAPITPIAPIAPVTPIAPVEIIAPIALPVAPKPIPTTAAAVTEPLTEPNLIGELFGQPSKTEWSPNEIVKNLAVLPGIAGAFVAMTDGLLVAAELPSHLKAETVAAFLPQIFGRMNQYAKELQIGALSSFSFVAENVSWHIVKTKTVYVVAIGKPGETLPGSTLNTVAAELGRQIQ